jgi:FAD/FMN-containing dehydrogenase
VSNRDFGALGEIVGDTNLITDRDLIGRRLQDNSWLSPILNRYIHDMADDSDQSLNVSAIASPGGIDELSQCAAAMYQSSTPLTILGAGTTNFGQTIPLEGGVVIDMKRLNSIDEPGSGRITCQAGAFSGAVDKIARESAQEIPVMTTTYANATSGGWVAGGHIGLGSPTWGSIWDGNILGATVMTVEAQPRLLSLDENSIEPILHSYGTTGIIVDVTYRLVEAHEWCELVITFDDFSSAARFTKAVSEKSDLLVRACAAQEPSVTPCFSGLRSHVDPKAAIVLSIVAESQYDEYVGLAIDFGGDVVPWRGRGADCRPTLAYMVYGHRMLWVKKIAPGGAFLHCYLDPDSPLEQLDKLKNQFGDEILVELKFLRSRWLRERFGHQGDGVLPAPLVCVVEGERRLGEVMGFCDQIGIRYQNPHIFFLDQKGLLRDPAVLLDFKAKTDPKGLLNPGKLSKVEART